MSVFRFTGRFGDAECTHGPTLIAEIADADLAYIDDPLSFPWELVEGHVRTCPFVIDISTCDADALIALRPALTFLTRHDTIVDSSDPASPAVDRFAQLVGASSRSASATGADSTRTAKVMEQAEGRLLERVRAERQTLIVDYEDLSSTEWHTTDWADPDDSRDCALAIRIPGEIIRAIRGGFGSFANTVLAATDSATILDVWGIRPDVGKPLDRAILVLARPAR